MFIYCSGFQDTQSRFQKKGCLIDHHHCLAPLHHEAITHITHQVFSDCRTHVDYFNMKYSCYISICPMVVLSFHRYSLWKPHFKLCLCWRQAPWQKKSHKMPADTNALCCTFCLSMGLLLLRRVSVWSSSNWAWPWYTTTLFSWIQARSGMLPKNCTWYSRWPEETAAVSVTHRKTHYNPSSFLIYPQPNPQTEAFQSHAIVSIL